MSDSTNKTGSWYCPVPFVHRVLRDQRRDRPAEFFSMRLGRPGTNGWRAGGFVLDLPNEPPTIDELEQCVSEQKYTDPKLVVTRVAAASIVNQLMLFGSDRIEVDLTHREEFVNQRWWEAIQWAAQKNQHETLYKYAEQYNSVPTKVVVPALPETDTPSATSESSLDILGLDVGATWIKAQWFRWSEGRLAQSSEVFRFKTGNPQKPYPNGEAFAKYVRTKLFDNAALDGRRVAAIGIGWPGAVAGDPGAEYVAATSGVLRYFDGFARSIRENRADAIHELRLREAFQTEFGTPVVRLVNDGVADIMGSQDKIFAPQGIVSIVLKAGTGTAFGVIVTDLSEDLSMKLPEPVPILGEIGKLIIDVGCPFPPPKKDFPEDGVANKHFSQQTIPRLAKAEAERRGWPDDFHLDSIRVAYFLADHDQMEAETLWLNAIETEAEENEVKAYVGRLFDVVCRERFHAERDSLRKMFADHQTSAHKFSQELVEQAGSRLADLIALVADMVDANQVDATGGPMTGDLGRIVREHARTSLRRRYEYEVCEELQDKQRGEHPIHRLYFPEPPPELQPKQKNVETGTRGAAILAHRTLETRRKIQQQCVLDIKISNMAQGQTISLESAGDGRTRYKIAQKDGTVLEQGTLDVPFEDACDYLNRNSVKLGIAKRSSQAGVETWVKIEEFGPFGW